MFDLHHGYGYRVTLLITSVLLLGLAAAGAAADTLRVPSEYPTIQAGIDAAQDGDEVLVADGVYTGEGNRDLDFGGKLITVHSENGPDNCIIDCEGTEEDPHRGFYFHNDETAAAVVEGFTIRNGFALQGGGIYCRPASPTISMCTLEDNRSESSGGGFYSQNGSPTIRSCTFIHNKSEGGPGGGAISCWDGSVL
ncbi:MAG: right-handed parallel beta-helix repeat-containing protein, partial [Planctomycetes bacterium]|nr:right-handed parallel beta-helix repeat-containing protein [Planctomycetota bacterium]